MKTTTFDTKQVALLLALLIIHNVFFQADCASFQPHQGTAFFSRKRMLRKLPLAPPPPQIGQAPHYKLPCPPPPPPLPLSHARHIGQSFRMVRRGSPPAPNSSRPRNFRIFLSPPPPPPLPPPPPSPSRQIYRRSSKCNIAPPPLGWS
ncbi:hypothetical protein QVD17_21253 [Tagetes erecta]|uniref:Uncharacterized protein n=1 Tax=Tagetes erecta TaxID=13708 RepID=A0AAD8KRK6_TARER|nr:hypothetical protein QVD17_21253 [Tagetes erecta]